MRFSILVTVLLKSGMIPPAVPENMSLICSRILRRICATEFNCLSNKSQSIPGCWANLWTLPLLLWTTTTDNQRMKREVRPIDHVTHSVVLSYVAAPERFICYVNSPSDCYCRRSWAHGSGLSPQ